MKFNELYSLVENAGSKGIYIVWNSVSNTPDFVISIALSEDEAKRFANTVHFSSREDLEAYKIGHTVRDLPSCGLVNENDITGTIPFFISNNKKNLKYIESPPERKIVVVVDWVEKNPTFHIVNTRNYTENQKAGSKFYYLGVPFSNVMNGATGTILIKNVVPKHYKELNKYDTDADRTAADNILTSLDD